MAGLVRPVDAEGERRLETEAMLIGLVTRSPSAQPRRLVAIGWSADDGVGAVAAGLPPWRGSSESVFLDVDPINSRLAFGRQPGREPMPRRRCRPAGPLNG